ncbi:hypothetical protein CIL05_10365 [Virgibacillus profundi]|uniref:Nucleotidyltransferase family protein n=1 Tax=Virgibacillus profundi TaxID=2024555 RepID=A0A2A2IF31_9BACI|nr:nucleotidyltransferase family protein [Virgibacillus profundi]PAV29760.1 hypothetical protein CIL05_10365 [Virgibacillus profundi]PXY53932.1 hypothetical protein CIT14_10470 [Virgibacillus profundi]
MKLENEADIIQIISEDQWMMNVLHTASELDLPDWWICAGFARSKIWDVLHGFEKRTEIADIDVVYYDEKNINEVEEKRLESLLAGLLPGLPWSVKNEARMHLRNNLDPYTDTEDAIAKFPETATALGVRLDNNGKLILTAPHGTRDVLNMVVRPTPFFQKSDRLMKIYEKRVLQKNWHSRWGMVSYSNE